ncbi:TetR/AcrR family transcriptional regulator [Halioglobus maricola]|uniref:TetR/AcrR family transcriptional regulator n=1 Tax=Halioglobus maricola TaxID=2601894 RepID=UPI00147860F8|nr:TetR family transcriptional regulator [Halioglobus maricola]
MAGAPASKSARRSHAEKRQETRGKILHAALDIIVEEGIRSVRNRAVAKRAGVSLGSTTYHFSSIEELIVSAFHFWRDNILITENPFFGQLIEVFLPYGDGSVPPKQRPKVAAKLWQISSNYLCDQLQGERRDRLLELAFYHESVRYPALREMINREWQAQLDILADVHSAMGSDDPDTDALLTAAVFRHLERSITLSEHAKVDTILIAVTTRRHLSQCFGFDIPEPD